MNIWLSLMQTVSKSLQADPVSAKGLDLQTGEVLYGTLLEMIDAETAVFELKGKTVRAQTEVQMPAGSRIPMLVVGTRESGQLELKVLTEETLPAAKTAQSFVKPEQAIEVPPLSVTHSGQPVATPPLSGADRNQAISPQLAMIPPKTQQFLDRLLVNLGLSPSPLLKTISQSLLQAKVSIQPTTLHAIETIVQHELNEYQIRMAQQNTQPVSAEIQRITNMSIQILTGMAQKQIPLIPPTYQSMKTLWNGPSLHHHLTNPEFPAQLRSELLSSFSLELSQLDSLTAVERGELFASAASRIGLDHETQLTIALLAQPQQPTEQADTLKSMLLKEQQQEPGSKALEQALYHVAGQQLMHSTRDDQSPFLYQFISLPMSVDNQSANAEIHILSRKKGSRQLDPNNCYLYFQLSMPSLGEVGIHVQVLERLVALRLVVEQDNLLNLRDSDLSILKAALEQAGYQLGTVRKETGSPATKHPFAQLPITVSAAGVDFRI